MKRILSVLICLLCTFYAESQTIDGLGVIRLGMTISDFQHCLLYTSDAADE